MTITNMNLNKFTEILISASALSRLNEQVLRFVCDTQKDTMTEAAKKVLALYFLLLEDGNTRMPLDADELYKRWEKKWKNLIALQEINEISEIDNNDVKKWIKEGIKDILEMAKHENAIFDFRDDDEITGEIGSLENQAIYDESAIAKTFVIHKEKSIQWLYAVQYFDAKCFIERKFAQNSHLFHGGRKPSKKDIETVKHESLDIQKESRKIVLKDAQFEAIARGKRGENLIITGGPGTGKTTVITYLLYMMLSQNSEMTDWPIYLTAPSGKAADRMRESVEESLEKLDESKCNCNILEKLKNLQSFTIHRLLSYNPARNAFTYNECNQFKEESIFVIDEASMIDISLFSSLLKAIPDKARIFILGDPDQLPSVEAGAVLGDLLSIETNYVVKLTESNRFNADSQIGILANNIQKDFFKSGTPCPDFNNDHSYTLDPNVRDKIQYLNVSSDTKDDKAFTQLIRVWTNTFYMNLYDEAKNIIPKDPKQQTNKDKAQYDKLWAKVVFSRILSAERRGPHGVENINKMIRDYVCKTKNISLGSDGYFPGQLLMLTLNQGAYKLYNGDSGIVVKSNNEQYYLMLKKQNYLFYPLSTFAKKSLETAFAITIHKAQGSGYPHVMMVLPEREGHPLLCKQILYTGVTRVEHKSLTIVARKETFLSACQNIIERDTGIRVGIKFKAKNNDEDEIASNVNTGDNITPFKDYYEALRIERNADIQTIDKARQNLIKIYTIKTTDKVICQIRIDSLQRIWDVLGTPDEKKAYDDQLTSNAVDDDYIIYL